VDESAKDLIELHKLTTEELRHTATIIWQFAIAIVTLQGGALGLGLHAGFTTGAGRGIVITGFLLSWLFSVMLVRQAVERRGFVERIRYLEQELRSLLPVFAIQIPRRLTWITSQFFAWFLFAESALALIVFIAAACLRCPSV